MVLGVGSAVCGFLVLCVLGLVVAGFPLPSVGAVGHAVGLGGCCVTVWLCWLCSPCSVLSLGALGVLVAGFEGVLLCGVTPTLGHPKVVHQQLL